VHDSWRIKYGNITVSNGAELDLANVTYSNSPALTLNGTGTNAAYTMLLLLVRVNFSGAIKLRHNTHHRSGIRRHISIISVISGSGNLTTLGAINLSGNNTYLAPRP